MASFQQIYRPTLEFYGLGHLANVKIFDQTSSRLEVDDIIAFTADDAEERDAFLAGNTQQTVLIIGAE